jgi:hypothetical protein
MDLSQATVGPSHREDDLAGNPWIVSSPSAASSPSRTICALTAFRMAGLDAAGALSRCER